AEIIPVEPEPVSTGVGIEIATQTEAFFAAPFVSAGSRLLILWEHHMSTLQHTLRHTAKADDASLSPLPNSQKTYVLGSREDIRVPFRAIAQTDTPASFGSETNPDIFVYDTSGPYTDPEVTIDIRKIGRASCRERRQITSVTGALEILNHSRSN